MEKLIAGVRAFHAQMKAGADALYISLADGQKPGALFIACSDSRVVPASLANSDPGDLFMMRNVGNLVPTANETGHSEGDRSEASAIEYATEILGVTDIVLCGHSGCGAMGAIAASAGGVLPVNLSKWLDLARPCLDASAFPTTLGAGFAPTDVLSQRNVVLQLRALETYPNVRAAQAERGLRLHGWWFDIGRARVSVYAPKEERFIDFDAAYGNWPQ